MKIFLFLSLLSILCFFNSCKKEEKKVVADKDAKFIREWQSKKIVIPHTSYIKIKPDHTFEFKDAGCQWRCNSFGKWKVINDTLILNSIPSKECQGLGGFGNNMEDPSKKEYERKVTVPGCKPDERNGVYVNFQNDKFYIKNDTLEYAANFKMPFGDRIAFFVKQ